MVRSSHHSNSKPNSENLSRVSEHQKPSDKAAIIEPTTEELLHQNRVARQIDSEGRSPLLHSEHTAIPS